MSDDKTESAPDTSWVKMQEQRNEHHSFYSFNNDPAKRNYLILLWFYIVYFIVSTSIWTVALHNKEVKLEKTRSESKVYYDQAVQNQLNYEQTREELNRAQQNLATTQAKLRSASNEASRLRAERASRSRNLVSISRGNLSNQQRSNSSFSDGLRDITMYCPTGSNTASGKRPERGMVATISRSIPFGTRIRIEGLGEYVVEDRIGYGSEFDIFTPDCAEADRFGRKRARVTILE